MPPIVTGGASSARPKHTLPGRPVEGYDPSDERGHPAHCTVATDPSERTIMADIVLINPRFELSYWGLERALPLVGKKCNLPTACLPLLAALTPPGHRVTIIDENLEPIDYDRVARADRMRAAAVRLPPTAWFQAQLDAL